jgi:tetratricopeptide (TPR) repeat protein
MVGWLLEAQGKQDEAMKAYAAAVNAGGNAPVAANNLAFMYAQRGTNLDEALQLATKAKQRMPEDANVDDTLGWIYYKKDQPQLAIGPLQDSLRRRPDNAETLFHLGLVQARLGQNVEARASLQRALRLDPKVGGGEAQRTLDAVSK